MTILAQDLINQLADELSDNDFVTWTAPEWLNYLNSAIRRICLVRPDASSTVEVLTLVAGTKQTIPATARRLLDIIRNMGTDSATPGKIITATDRSSMDLYRPTWHKDTAKTYVDHFMYDDKIPTVFYVTPPVSSTVVVTVEAELATDPTILTDASTQNIPIPDVYEPAIRHWMLYMAYGKETDAATSNNDARFNYQAFHDILGIKTTTDSSMSPSRETRTQKQ